MGWNIGGGIVLVILSLSGDFVLAGTESSGWLLVVGLGLLVFGIFQWVRAMNSQYVVSDRNEAMTVLEVADELESQGNWQKAEAYRLGVPPPFRREYESLKKPRASDAPDRRLEKGRCKNCGEKLEINWIACRECGADRKGRLSGGRSQSRSTREI